MVGVVVVVKTGEAESHMVSYFNMCDRKYGQMGGWGGDVHSCNGVQRIHIYQLRPPAKSSSYETFRCNTMNG